MLGGFSLQPLLNQWIMKQNWSDLLFIHWSMPKNVIAPYIPKSLELDSYDHHAWLSVVLFCMEGTYLRGIPKLSVFRSFPQINFRTYVRYNGNPGIFFLSLDTSHFLTYSFSKKLYKLPFFHALMDYKKNGNELYMKCSRKNEKAQLEVNYVPFGEPKRPKKDSIEQWLTERYRMYTVDHSGNVFFCDVEHNPMKLQSADARILQNSLLFPFQHELKKQPFVYFSKGVIAKVGLLQKCK